MKVSHAFKETYDSASVMVMKDLSSWAKCCFELTDFGTHAAVSVVTKGDSDDANRATSYNLERKFRMRVSSITGNRPG